MSFYLKISNMLPTRVQLKHRRLQMFGGKPSAGKPLELEPLPAHVEALAQRLHQLGVFKQPPHHVLVNEYTAGSGIMPHKVDRRIDEAMYESADGCGDRMGHCTLAKSRLCLWEAAFALTFTRT